MMMMAKRSGGISYFRNPAHSKQNSSVGRTAVPEKDTPTLRLATSAGSPEYGAAVVLSAVSLPSRHSNGGSKMEDGKVTLIIKEYETVYAPQGNDPYFKCEICEAMTIKRPQTWGLYMLRQSDTAAEPIGDICPPCASRDADEMRVIMLLRGENTRVRGLLASYLKLELTEALDNPEKLKAVLDKALNNYAHDEQGYWAELELLGSYIDFTDIQRPHVNVAASPKNEGYIYLLGTPEGYCKIGRAKRVTERILQIGLQMPFRVELLHTIRVTDSVWAERYLHQKFASCRMNGEWFLLSDFDINWIKSLSALEPE